MKKLIYLLWLALMAIPAMAQHRVVLIEQFTNSGCPPCAGNTPVVASYVNARPDSVLMIAYHTSFPYQDSMYHENPAESNNRVSYYNVVGVPRSIVDGNYFSGNLLATINTTIPNRQAIAPRYQISFLNSTLTGNLVDIALVMESIDPANQNESLTGHVVLVEKNVLKSSYVCCAGANAENEYPWVMRKMLPDAGGTSLLNTFSGGMDIINFSVAATNFKDLSELRIIAFVQNNTTKEIYQASMSNPVISTSLQEVEDNIFYLIHSTDDNTITLHFTSGNLSRKIEIVDILGKVVYSESVKEISRLQVDVSQIKNGLYFVKVSEPGSALTIKTIIQN